MRETEINNKIMSGNEEPRFGKLNFLGDSIKDILFEENYLVVLKEKVLRLNQGQIQQRELKKLIIEHGLKSVEDIKEVIKFFIEAEIRKYIENPKAQKGRFEKYKQLLSKIAYRIDKIYRKLNNSDKLELDKITSKKVRDSLISAEKIFEYYKSNDYLPDASPIINNYAKALEIMLDECISVHFKSLIKKKYFQKQMSPDIYKKFGWLKDNKSIPLGVWVKIIESFEDEESLIEIKEFKDCLLDKIDNGTLHIIKDACLYLADLRNSKSHRETITMEEIFSHRTEIITLLNPIIVNLY